MKTTEATATTAIATTTVTESPLNGESDGELLHRFSTRGDQAAFSRLVARHGPMVLRLCRRMCDGDSHAAEDLAQQVFLQLASRATALQTRISIAGWLYRTSWHVSTRHRRDGITRAAHEREAVAVRTAEAAAVRPDGDIPFAVITSELGAALSRGLAMLPENQRNALVLHYFAGHTVEETATVLGVRIGTAASWLSRGRDMLRGCLDRQGVTAATDVAAVWLVQEAAKLPLCSPGEATVRGLEAKLAAPAALAATPALLGCAAAGGVGAGAGITGGFTFLISRAAASVIVGALTVGGGGIAAASVIPGGLGGIFNPSSGRGGGTGSLSAKPSEPSSLSFSRSRSNPSPMFVGGGSASLPEPSGVAVLAAAAALALRRQRRQPPSPQSSLSA